MSETRHTRGLSIGAKDGAVLKMTDLVRKISSAGDLFQPQHGAGPIHVDGEVVDVESGNRAIQLQGTTDEEKKAAKLRQLKVAAAHFHQSSHADLYAELKTNPEKGLSSTEASMRLVQYGPNEIEQDPPDQW
jgi:magnesium-transporting ATPase (P-type)